MKTFSQVTLKPSAPKPIIHKSPLTASVDKNDGGSLSNKEETASLLNLYTEVLFEPL